MNYSNHTLPKMQETCSFSHKYGDVKILNYSNDGKLLASIDEQGLEPGQSVSSILGLIIKPLANGLGKNFSAKIWNVQQLSEVITFPIQTGDRIDHIEFCPDNTSLATSDGDNIKVWDSTGKSSVKVNLTGDTGAFCFIPHTNNRVVYHSISMLTGVTLYVHELSTNQIINKTVVDAMKDFIWSMACDYQGRYVVAGGANRLVIWDFDSRCWFSNHLKNRISKVLCHHDGEIIFAASGSNILVATHSRSIGTRILQEFSVGKEITDIALLGDNLLICCGDHKLRIVNLRKSQTPRIEEMAIGNTASFRAYAIAANPRHMEFAVGSGKTIKVWSEIL